MDDLDPKAFIDDMHRLDVRTLKVEIEQAVPGVVVPVVHVLRPMQSGAKHDLYVYYAKEPVSDNGFDSRNYPSHQDQQAVTQAINTWVERHALLLLDVRNIQTSALYKSASPCILLKLYISTPENTQIVGHQNDEISQDVRTKRGAF